MYNLRLAFAYLLPGLITTLVFIASIGINVDQINFGILTLYILISLVIGVIIDLSRTLFEGVFIKSSGFYRIKKAFNRILKLFNYEFSPINLKEANETHDKKRNAAIEFWIKTQLSDKSKFREQVEANEKIKSEYYKPDIKPDDNWVMHILISTESMSFYLKEFFVFYQFSFNLLIATVICFFVNFISLFIFGPTPYFWIVLITSFPLFALLHSSTVCWLLSCKRYTGKLIQYHLLQNTNQ